jgi:hypothetical protein
MQRVVHWTDSSFLQTVDSFPGSVGRGLVHVEHQSSGCHCQIKLHSFDDLGNNVATEIGSGGIGFMVEARQSLENRLGTKVSKG